MVHPYLISIDKGDEPMLAAIPRVTCVEHQLHWVDDACRARGASQHTCCTANVLHSYGMPPCKQKQAASTVAAVL